MPNSSPAQAFVPLQETTTCSAFTATFKVLALGIVTVVMVWGATLWGQGALGSGWRANIWLLAPLALMLYTEWHILRGRTTLSAQALEQTWVWSKRVALSELVYAKLIRVRGLEWLIAPRLYTRTHTNRLTVFYASSANMLGEMERLQDHLHRMRQA